MFEKEFFPLTVNKEQRWKVFTS